MDSLGAYLRSIGRIPLLTAAEEIQLGRDIKNGLEIELQVPPGERDNKEKRTVIRGQRAKKRMMEANLRLVVSVAKKYMNFGMDLMDLIQEGSLGLNRAVEKFDPERGYKFSTYAYWWIRQSMTRALDTQSRTIRLPLHLSEIYGKIRKLTREMEITIGRKPTYEELAEHCGCTPDRIREVTTAFTPIASLNAVVGNESDRSALQDLIPAELEEMINEYELSDPGLIDHYYMKPLNDREKLVIDLYYGLSKSEPMTLNQIAKEIPSTETGKPVSRERVRQMKENALNKMRWQAAAAESAAEKRRAERSPLVQSAFHQISLEVS